MESEGMSNQQLNSLLETLAQLIEAKAVTIEEPPRLCETRKFNP